MSDYSSGEVTAKITGSVTTSSPDYPAGATQVAGSNTATNATSTVYTVTAGKTLHITSIVLCASGTAAGANVCTVKLDGVVYVRVAATPAATTSVASVCPVIPFTLAATKTVTVTSDTGNVEADCSITGYEI